MTRTAYNIHTSDGTIADECIACARISLVDVMHDDNALRGVRAAIRLAIIRHGEDNFTPEQVIRIARDSVAPFTPSCVRASQRADMVARDISCDIYRHGGNDGSVHCGGCNVELEPAWVTCILCGNGGLLGEEYDELDADHGYHDGDHTVCGDCTTTDWYRGTDLREKYVAWLDANLWERLRHLTWREREDKRTVRKVIGFGAFLKQYRRDMIDTAHGGGLFPTR